MKIAVVKGVVSYLCVNVPIARYLVSANDNLITTRPGSEPYHHNGKSDKKIGQ